MTSLAFWTDLTFFANAMLPDCLPRGLIGKNNHELVGVFVACAVLVNIDG